MEAAAPLAAWVVGHIGENAFYRLARLTPWDTLGWF